MGIVRAAIRAALILLASLLLLTSRGSLNLSPAQELAKAHLYSLVQWEMENFLDKWLYRAWLLLPGNSLEEQARIDLVLEYFQLGDRERELEREIQRAEYLPSAGNANGPLGALKEELSRVKRERHSMRDGVEEVLEGEIGAVVAQEGLSLGGPIRSLGVRFPPVDFRLNPSPKVLVLSPRDRIEMVQGVLLMPDITQEEMEALEERVLAQEDLSALVTGTGGVATYPSVVSPDLSLRQTLTTASHEWLHHYLFFRPLGQAYGKDPDMTSLNETLANIFAEEIGERVYQRFQESIETISSTGQEEEPAKVEQGFDYRLEMRATRLRVEELLREGRIEEAEEYMEQRRQLFVEHGHLIRKLNQAYFAFHGTYADSPASISPIYEQLQSLRDVSQSLGALVRRVSSVSTYADFLEMLDAEADTRIQRPGSS